MPSKRGIRPAGETPDARADLGVEINLEGFRVRVRIRVRIRVRVKGRIMTSRLVNQTSYSHSACRVTSV